MKDPRIEKLADLLVNYSVAVQPKQTVAIRGSVEAEPLVKAVYKKVLEAGGYPFLLLNFPDLPETFYRIASDDQLAFVPEPMKIIYETYDVVINLLADRNTKGLTSADPSRMAIARRATASISQVFLERAAKGELKWTLTNYPTQAYAQDAEMSLDEYTEFVLNACMPDANDPVSYWKKVSAYQEKIVKWLEGKKQVHVTAPETDLRLSIEGRTFINCDCH